MLSASQWFIAMLAAALGLVAASLMWRLPIIQSWEAQPDQSTFPPFERDHPSRPAAEAPKAPPSPRASRPGDQK